METREENKVNDKSTAVAELIEVGKKKGVLSFKEVEDAHRCRIKEQIEKGEK